MPSRGRSRGLSAWVGCGAHGERDVQRDVQREGLRPTFGAGVGLNREQRRRHHRITPGPTPRNPPPLTVGCRRLAPPSPFTRTPHRAFTKSEFQTLRRYLQRRRRRSCSVGSGMVSIDRIGFVAMAVLALVLLLDKFNRPALDGSSRSEQQVAFHLSGRRRSMLHHHPLATDAQGCLCSPLTPLSCLFLASPSCHLIPLGLHPPPTSIFGRVSVSAMMTGLVAATSSLQPVTGPQHPGWKPPERSLTEPSLRRTSQ